MADGITRIAVEGFKSIAKRQEIEIAPLTILAGANSSGKSSIMQPLLMLKQTLEAPYDPGPVKIDGANVRFTSSDQFLSKIGLSPRRLLRIGINTEGAEFSITFVKGEPLKVQEETYTVPGGAKVTLRPVMSQQEITNALPDPWKEEADQLSIDAYRFFLAFTDRASPPNRIPYPDLGIEDVIHVPGLRGNPLRTYSAAHVTEVFPGTFDNYVASVILAWEKDRRRRYEALNLDLQRLDLAQIVHARRITDVAIELQVGIGNNDPQRLDNIADVGFGVSQVLPALVALRAADPGRLVYLEEPEIHLHPRAQAKLADILADAAKRGVRVVAETHSSLLLRAVQTLVAKGDLDPELVRLHWFTRDAGGVTQVSSAKPDANGAFGDWPVDFGDVALRSEQEYLDAVEDRLTH
ncbi:MAG: AAA family ATPase [Bryobacteraceae bacterium]|jgi:hypothetical protein